MGLECSQNDKGGLLLVLCRVINMSSQNKVSNEKVETAVGDTPLELTTKWDKTFPKIATIFTTTKGFQNRYVSPKSQ